MVRQIAKFTDAVKLLHSGATVTVWNLEREHQLFNFQMNEGKLTDAQKASYEFIADLRQIADRFNLDLKLPEDVSDSDFEAISFLKGLMQGIEYNSDYLTITLAKSETNVEAIENLAPVMAFRTEHETYEPKPTLFGHQVNTGPVTFTINQAEISDYEATLAAFKAAQIGDAVPFKLIPRGAARLELAARNG